MLKAFLVIFRLVNRILRFCFLKLIRREKMKKFLLITVIFIFAFLAVGCGGGNSGKKGGEADNPETGDSDELDDSDISDSTDSGSNDSGDSADDADSGDSGGSNDSGDSTDDADSADSGDDTDSGDITDSGDEPLPDDMTLEELKAACQNKETVNEIKYDCSLKDCQRFDFCDSGGKIGENTVAKCRDGEDSDGDGYADCLDPECQEYRFCNLEGKSAEETECLKLIDEKGAVEACKSDKCKNIAICETPADICELGKDPYKYEKGKCECGWTRSKMLEEMLSETAEDKYFCAFNLDNENIMQFVSPISEVDNNPMPNSIILKTNIELGTQNPWIMLNGHKGKGKQFEGDFDGNGKRIRGNLTCGKNEHACGLFGTLVAATVRNFKLDFTIKGPEKTGALAGASSYGEIGDIKSSAKVYADNNPDSGSDNCSAVAGGIVGTTDSTRFDNISLSGSVSAETKMNNSTALAGGVVGLGVSAKIYNVKSSATVTSFFNGQKYKRSILKGCAGGIAGFLTELSRLENVEVKASVKASSQIPGTRIGSGGIAGCITDLLETTEGKNGYFLEINDSYPYAKSLEAEIISAKSAGSVGAENTSLASGGSEEEEADSDHDELAGGIAGIINSTNEKSVITGAYSESAIECQSSSGKGTTCIVGGILGYARKNAILRSVSYKGKIETLSGRKNSVGGVVGYATFDSRVANASASGSITVKDGDSKNLTAYAGGIIGYIQEDSNVINTYNNIVIKKQFTSETASFTAGAVAGYGGSNTKLYESYWNPLTLPDEQDVNIVGQRNGIQVDTTCHKYDESGDHKLENVPESESPKLFDRLRYNIGVYLPGEGIFGVASPNLPYADDYRTWKTYKDSDNVSWPVIDLESEERFEGGSN